MILVVTILFIIVFFLRYNFYRIPKKGVPILLYHNISDKKSNTNLDKFTISLKTFEKHLKFFEKLGYKTIKANDLENILNNKLYKHNKYLLITFDDGYKNNLEAANLLKKYGFTGIFFLSAAYIGKSLENTSMLNENDLEQLIALGMQIGSHSHEHKKISTISNQEMIYQIKTSIEVLSKYQKIEDFAYPFGNYSDEIEQVLSSYGIKRAYIIGQKLNTADYKPFYLKRSIVRRSTNYLDLYLILTRGRSRL